VLPKAAGLRLGSGDRLCLAGGFETLRFSGDESGNGGAWMMALDLLLDPGGDQCDVLLAMARPRLLLWRPSFELRGLVRGWRASAFSGRPRARHTERGGGSARPEHRRVFLGCRRAASPHPSGTLGSRALRDTCA
jgi:hypothetical protein